MNKAQMSTEKSDYAVQKEQKTIEEQKEESKGFMPKSFKKLIGKVEDPHCLQNSVKAITRSVCKNNCRYCKPIGKKPNGKTEITCLKGYWNDKYKGKDNTKLLK